MIRWLVRHPALLGFLHQFIGLRGRRCPDFLDAAVWRALDEERGFREKLRKARSDMAAGRFYRYEHDGDRRVLIPNPDWPADGEQPNGPVVI